MSSHPLVCLSLTYLFYKVRHRLVYSPHLAHLLSVYYVSDAEDTVNHMWSRAQREGVEDTVNYTWSPGPREKGWRTSGTNRENSGGGLAQQVRMKPRELAVQVTVPTLFQTQSFKTIICACRSIQVEVRGRLAGICSLLLQSGCWGPNSYHQDRWQVPLPSEPSHGPSRHTSWHTSRWSTCMEGHGGLNHFL